MELAPPCLQIAQRLPACCLLLLGVVSRSRSVAGSSAGARDTTPSQQTAPRHFMARVGGVPLWAVAGISALVCCANVA